MGINSKLYHTELLYNFKLLFLHHSLSNKDFFADPGRLVYQNENHALIHIFPVLRNKNVLTKKHGQTYSEGGMM